MTFKELTDKQQETALKTAAAGFETWRRTAFAELRKVNEPENSIQRRKKTPMKRSLHALVIAGLALGSLASAQASIETYDIEVDLRKTESAKP